MGTDCPDIVSINHWGLQSNMKDLLKKVVGQKGMGNQQKQFYIERNGLTLIRYSNCILPTPHRVKESIYFKVYSHILIVKLTKL